MKPDLFALQFVMSVFAHSVARKQQHAIDYLLEENRILAERVGGRRLRLTDRQRRRLAVKGKALGRKELGEYATMVTPDTVLRWHRRLIVGQDGDSKKRGPGRPRTRDRVAPLVVRMAAENPRWGYTRIQGSLAPLSYKVGRNTIKRILIDHGIEPAPERGRRMRWSTFLKAHWPAIVDLGFSFASNAATGPRSWCASTVTAAESILARALAFIRGASFTGELLCRAVLRAALAADELPGPDRSGTLEGLWPSSNTLLLRIVDDHNRFDVQHGFAYDLVPPNGEATQEDAAAHPWSSSSVGAADDLGLLEFVEPAAPKVAGTRGLVEVRPQRSASGKFGSQAMPAVRRRRFGPSGNRFRRLERPCGLQKVDAIAVE